MSIRQLLRRCIILKSFVPLLSSLTLLLLLLLLILLLVLLINNYDYCCYDICNKDSNINNQDSSVGIAVRSWATHLRNCVLILDRGKKLYSSPKYLDWLWSPLSFLLSRYWVTFAGTKVTEAWSSPSPFPTPLQILVIHYCGIYSTFWCTGRIPGFELPRCLVSCLFSKFCFVLSNMEPWDSLCYEVRALTSAIISCIHMLSERVQGQVSASFLLMRKLIWCTFTFIFTKHIPDYKKLKTSSIIFATQIKVWPKYFGTSWCWNLFQ